MDIVVLGSYNTDLMSRTPHLPKPGETIMGGPFVMGAGGKGCNQATAAARMGLDVHIVARLGSDEFSKIAIDNFKKAGLNTDCIIIDEEMHTGVALIMVDDGAENCIVVAPGANTYFTESEINNIQPLIKSSKLLLMQLEINMQAVEQAARIAHENGVRVILNPAPACKLSKQLISNTDIITPNETEAEIMTGVAISDIGSANEAAKLLIQQGAGSVIMTLGSKGALYMDNERHLHVPAFDVDAVDTTGAGDAFNGGLCAALAEGKPMEQAITFASAVAALSVTKMGAADSMPGRNEVDEFIKTASPKRAY